MDLPDYLAICSREKAELLPQFNEVFQRNSELGGSFEFRSFKDESFQAAEVESIYLWLEKGTVSASYEDANFMDLGPGDAIALSAMQSVAFKGQGQFWLIRSQTGHSLPFSGISRLSDLKDTSGGCNDSENAFRRLQITWDESTATEPDGHNVVGCHVVWIEGQSSRSHYHPIPPTHGGMKQHEMYLVLDPEDFGLKGTSDRPGVWTYPEYGRWDEPLFTPLKPGDVFFIAAPAVHRAVDVLTSVIALPGFKPDNEIFVDQDIYDQSAGKAPCNLEKVQQGSSQITD